MNKEELNTILENHEHWLNRDCNGYEEMKADLSEVFLSEANLSEANLSEANLREAFLREADLRGADLRRADLRGADICGANLSEADLRGANLSEADLRGADLRRADLRRADLRRADLRWADLRGADICGADICGADLRWADLRGAKNIPFVPYACPDFGSFIGYKKAKGKIVELEIPDDARRCSSTGRKCRCSKAKVLGIYNYNHELLDCEKVESDRGNLTYKVGKTVYPDSYDEDRWNECSNGIHFFFNFQEAVDY